MSRQLLTFALLLTALALPARGFIDIRGTMPAKFERLYIEYDYDRIWRTVAPKQKSDHFTLTVIYFLTHKETPLARLLPEWGGGGALGPDTIIIPIDKDPILGMNIMRTTVHEMAHCVLRRAYPRLQIPRWFHEGVAMTLAGELNFREEVILSEAALTNSLVPLLSIDSVNAFNESRAALAYAESHVAVRILLDKYGIDAVGAILSKGNRYNDFWRGFKDEMGMDDKEYNELVAQEIRSRYLLLFIFGDEYLFWFLLSLLFVAGLVATAIRSRRKKRMMEIQESGPDEAEIPVTPEQPPELPPPPGPPPTTVAANTGEVILTVERTQPSPSPAEERDTFDPEDGDDDEEQTDGQAPNSPGPSRTDGTR
jgi:hypothetical protein